MKFTDIAGNKKLIHSLAEGVHKGRVSGSQMFTGTQGSGALPLTIAYVQYLFCENKNDQDSCGVCSNCKKIAQLQHPDVHFSYPFFNPSGKSSEKINSENFLTEWRSFVAETPYGSTLDWYEKLGNPEKQGFIPTREGDRIHSKLSLKAYEGKYKVMILWMPEMLHTATANKLLKLIEEPPEKTLIFLVSENPSAVLPTIISRVQISKVMRPNSQELIDFLTQNHEVDLQRASTIARLSEGDVQFALKQLHAQESENATFVLFRDWMRLCYGKKIGELVDWCGKFHKSGRETQKNFLFVGTQLLRQCLMNNYLGSEHVRLEGEQKKFIVNFSPFVHAGNFEEIIGELEKAMLHIERNGYAKVILLDMSLRVVKLLARKPQKVTS